MFDNISKNWRKDKLKNILDILRNGANIKQLDNANGIPISRIETIANGYVDFNKVGYANVYDDKYKSYYIRRGDILLSHINSIAHLGKCAFCNFDNKLIHGMNLLLLRANKNILPKLLYYLLNSELFKNQLPSITKKSVNQASISITNLGNLDILYPIDKNEQQEIVDVLDAASEIIRLRTACIKSAQSLIPALFQEMFSQYANSQSRIKLNYLFEFRSGGTPSKQVKEFFTGNIPWITTIALNKLFIDQNDANELITEDAIKNSATKLIPENSLLFGTRVGIGKLAINKVPMCTNQDIVSLIPLRNNNLNLIYTYWYLKQMNNFFVANGRGATIKGITTNLVKNTEIIIPPIEQQELFAAKVQEIEAYIKTQQAELENAKNMFQSLLHHAFTGKLTENINFEVENE